MSVRYKTIRLGYEIHLLSRKKIGLIWNIVRVDSTCKNAGWPESYMVISPKDWLTCTKDKWNHMGLDAKQPV